MKTISITLFTMIIALAGNVMAQQTTQDNNVDTDTSTAETATLDDQEAPQQTSNTNIGQQIIELQQSNQVYQQVIKNLIKRIEDLEHGSVQPPEAQNTAAETSTSPELREKIEQQMQQNTELINSAFEQRLSKEGGMLLGYGKFTYEPSLSFTNSSYETVVVDGYTVYPVLVVGDIVSERVKRKISTLNHSLRFGLGLDTQLDIMIPMSTEREDYFREDGTNEERKGDGIGDISLGISYQLVKSNPDWPDTVIALNWKSQSGDDPYDQESSENLAIGSGFDTYSISLTSMANRDPVVVFGGVTVNYSGSDHKPVGRVQPGMNYGINLGMALALNMDTSLSFSFQYADSEKTAIDGSNINGSDVTTGIFSIGLSTAMNDTHVIDIDLGIGLTSDSPDFQLSFSFPLQFSFSANNN